MMDQGWRSVSFSAGEARALLLLLGRAEEFFGGEYAAKNQRGAAKDGNIDAIQQVAACGSGQANDRPAAARGEPGARPGGWRPRPGVSG